MIDASIPLQVKQFDLAGSFQNGQALRMNQMKMQEAQQELADKRLERQTYAQMFANPQSMDPANRQQTIGQIGQHNPELAFKLQQHFATMDKQSRDIEMAKWAAADPVLYRMQSIPASERPAFLQSVAPRLMAAGWTADDLQKVDLSDQSIKGLATTAQTVAQLEPKIMPIQENGSIWDVSPGRAPRAIVSPNDGTHPMGSPVNSGIAHVTDAATYAAVPPGGQYITPDGQIRVKSGGQSLGSANFPR